MSESQVYERYPLIRATIIVVVATLVLSALMLIDPRSWYLVSLTATLGWFAWVLWVWPRVTVGSDDLVIRNAFTTATVPFADVASVRSGFTLHILTKSSGRVTAFGVHGRTGMGREAVRTAQAYSVGVTPVRRVDDLRPTIERTQASQVADIIARRLESARNAGSARTRRRPNVGVIAVTVVLLAADAAALALVYL
jgi:hypothetical protein